MRAGILVFIGFLISNQSCQTAGRFENPWISESLGLAHHYYLEGKFADFSLAMKAILTESSDSLERRNILDLFRQIQAQHQGQVIPVDWNLPSEMSDLELVITQNSNPRFTEYGVTLSFRTKQARELQLLKLTPRGEAPILDYEGRIGELERNVSPDKESGVSWRFSRFCNAPLGEGLYELKAVLKGMQPLNAWFVLTEHKLEPNPSLLARKSSFTSTKFEVFQFSSRNVPMISTLVRRKGFVEDQVNSELLPRYKAGGMSAEGETLHLDQDRTHRFGDLILHHKIHSEVHLDPR